MSSMSGVVVGLGNILVSVVVSCGVVRLGCAAPKPKPKGTIVQNMEKLFEFDHCTEN